MIGRIMMHEWRLLVREKLLYIAIPVYALLLAYGVFTGTQWKAFLAGNAAEAVALADKKLASIRARVDWIEAGGQVVVSEDPRFPAKVARFQAYEMAAKPPIATAAVAIGQSDIQPSYLKVQWAPMFTQANTDEIENPTNLAVGLIDLGFVLIYLFPLLIIALSYNMLSSERENGTQVLLLSQPVRVQSFVLGKVLLRGALIIGLAVLLSVAGLLIGSSEIIGSGESWRLIALIAVVAAYGAFWFGLSITVNAFSKTSSTNALILMSIWLALVLIVPATLSLVAKSMYPLPSRIEMTQALRRADALVKKEVGYQRPFNTELLGRGTEVALDATIGQFYKELLPLEQRAEAVAAPIFKQFDEQRSAQQQLAARLKYLSPAILAQFAFHEIAGHSVEDMADFNRQIETYHQRWREYFAPIAMADRLMARDEIYNIPRFEYRPRMPAMVLRNELQNVAALCGFALLALGFGFWRLRRYQPAAR